jgi:hypothetical protein
MGPYLEKILYKTRAGGVGQGIGPEFKPPYCQKKKKRQPMKQEEIFVNHISDKGLNLKYTKNSYNQ